MAVVAKRAVSRPISLPSPVGGWNARDALPNMGPLDAVVLTNWFPASTECTLRSGYSRFATGFGNAQVETLMAYAGGTTNKLLAIAGGSVYDITAGGATGAASLTGLTNSRFGYCNISNSAGTTYLCMANGADGPRLFDGTTWTTPTITGTGLTSTKLDSPITFQNRMWFIETGTMNVWYLGTQAVSGSATKIDLSAYLGKGGFIIDHATWTIDAGDGVNDHYVVVTNKGQVIVFQGTDPSSASTWAMRGVWDIGGTIGKRCLYKYAGDLLVICQDGLLPMSQALQSSRINPKVSLTDKIQAAITQAISTYGSNFGWQTIYVPRINQLWLNVPISTGSNVQQFVMNTITGAWCNYTGWNANCWEMYNDIPYFGGNGFVGKAYDTFADNGANINGFGLQAFNSFGSAGMLKRYTMSRPILRSNGFPAIYAGINVDFNTSEPVTSLTYSPSTYGAWDSAIWDSATWGGDLNIVQNWQGLNGVGYYAAPIVKVACSGIQTTWVSTDVVVEQGAIL